MSTELEQVEYRLLCQAIRDACRELRWGDVEAGRRHLTEGLARASECAASGAHWGDQLAKEYRTAFQEYDQLASSYLRQLREYRLVAPEPELQPL